MKRQFFHLAGFLLALAAPAFCGAQVHVEQVQRDYQVRYHAITGGWLKWPTCSSGSPAPAFPKDGFYGDLTGDPDKAVEVVSNLLQCFHVDAIIYGEFVKATNFSDLEGVSSIPVYGAGDMLFLDPAAVTPNNYPSMLQALRNQVARLTLVQVVGSQIVTNDDSDSKLSDNGRELYYPSDSLCGTLQACMATSHSYTEWGEWAEYGDGTPPFDCETAYFAAPINLAAEYFPGVYHYSTISRVFESGLTTQADPEFGEYVYLTAARNTRGRIRADLSRYQSGIAKVFLQLTRPSCSQAFWVNDRPDWGLTCSAEFAQTGPTSAAENSFGIWEDGFLTVGSVSTTTNYITTSESVPEPMGDCAPDTYVLYGWSVSNAVVIVRPDFTVIPDLQDCCGACNGEQCGPGALTTTLQSVHVSMGLGKDDYQSAAGYVSLSAEVPSAALATLSALRFSTLTNVYIASNSTPPLVHLQLRTSQVLADIKTNNAFSYAASFYTIASAGALDTNNFYQPIASPFKTITIENPTATTNNVNELKLTAVSDGVSNVTTYTYDTNTLRWSMGTGDGLRNESRMAVWSSNHLDRVETFTITNAANQLTYKELNIYHLFPWGQERLTNIVDPDGEQLTSAWIFYTNAATDGGGYRQLKEQIDSSGHWTIFAYDSVGRETNRITQFLSQTSTNASLNRVTQTIYSTNAPQVTVIESLLGSEVSRRYQIVQSGKVQNIECQTVGAAINAVNNLTNITETYTNGSFAGQTSRTRNPNGTVQVYLYSTNATQKATVVLSGVADPGSTTNILDGTITTTITLLGGQTVTNIVMARQLGGSDTLVGKDFFVYTDAQLRSHYIVHLDGTTNFYNYACCGLDNETDRDGTFSQYFHDSLNRQTAVMRNGIVYTNILDANGAALASVRVGSNGSQIFQKRCAYDLAGRVARETNALGGVTVYTNYFDGSHQPVRQATYPDGGTRIETFYQDGATLSVTGSAVQPESYLYGVDGDGQYTTLRRLDGSGGTNEWVKTYTDPAGRQFKTVYAGPGSATAVSYFNALGEMTNSVDPDGVSTLFGYNAKGEQSLSVLDSNRNYMIDFAGADRITFVTNDVVSAHGTVVKRSRTFVWSTSGGSSNLIATSESSVDGLQSWSTVWNGSLPLTTHQQTETYPASNLRVQTVTKPEGTYTVTSNRFGHVISVTTRDSVDAQISSVTLSYDAHGRQTVTTDARSGSATTYYNDADQVSGTISPVPASGQAAQVTSNFFDLQGRTISSKLPDNTFITNKYDVTGLLTNTFGSRTYPVGYTYDSQGRMRTMRTWKSFVSNSGAATTSWGYDDFRGWLTNKTYNGGAAGPGYSYTAGGRLATRVWARGSVTTYSLDNAGEVSEVNYSDGITPSIAYSLDRRGRLTAVERASATCFYALDDLGAIVSESYSGGPLNGITISNRYDQFMRRTNLTLYPDQVVTAYAFDAASRLSGVTDGTNVVGYAYTANSPLISQISFTNAGVQRLVTTKQHDLLNRLTNISSISSVGSVGSSAYTYNSANQRIRRTDLDSSYWVYSYDSLGQVTGGKRYWSDGTPVAGQQFEYTFDDIGNRTSTAVGGDENGVNLRNALYGANNLNQYTNRNIPGYLDIMGSAHSNSSVTIWTSDGLYAPAYRRGDYYRAELATNNNSQALWLTWTNLAVLGNGTNADIITNTVGNTFLRKNSETFIYDEDGDLKSDGAWTNTWDAERRLVQTESLSLLPGAARKKLEFGYDHLGRRIQKIVSIWNGTIYVPQSTNRYVYDGWNLSAILDHTNGLVATFGWGLDISGSPRGSGGVGGLLWATSRKLTGPQTYFYVFDGNGNVEALSSAADGAVAARYEYGPFGELIRSTGEASQWNPFLYSSCQYDPETKLVYFGRRYYSPAVGAWLSREPLGEGVSPNLYSFVYNSAPNFTDRLGFEPMGNPVTGPNGPVGPSTLGGLNYWYYTPPISEYTRRFLFRVDATLQCVGGALETVGGIGLATGGAGLEVWTVGASTPVSAPAMVFGGAFFVNGIDNAITGYKKVLYLYDFKTWTEQSISFGISKVGVPKAYADSIAAGINNAGLVIGSAAGSGGFKLLCCSKPRLAVTVEVTAADTGLADLAQFRRELGPIPGGGKPDGGTLARLDIDGNSYYGISAHGTEISLDVNAITETHAEADAFQQAANAGMSAETATLYVDRPLCGACGANGGVNSLARQLGIKQLTIVTPEGTTTITIR